jgi:hypothetical protein
VASGPSDSEIHSVLLDARLREEMVCDCDNMVPPHQGDCYKLGPLPSLQRDQGPEQQVPRASGSMSETPMSWGAGG